MIEELHQTGKQSNSCALTLILCSRNDQYMGNSRWRLETSLNYAARKVHEIGRPNDVEIVVTDWGSETPLHEALKLSAEAAAMVSFVVVSPSLASELQQDSPFAEVIALNAAAKRAKGNYIGRIDQDTLVGRRFLEFFFEVYDGKRELEIPMEKAQMFANQRMVPYRFTSRCPSFQVAERFIHWFGQLLTMEHRKRNSKFYSGGVGIWLLHRDLWNACGGYDERMIYMNAMETNMVQRLLMKYQLINLGKLVSYDFYHLEHYHPLSVRKSSSHRKVNPDFPFSKPTELHPNPQSWGLANYDLPVFSLPSGNCIELEAAGFLPVSVSTTLSVFLVVPAICSDSIRKLISRWRRRMGIALDTVKGEPLARWPQVLKKRWIAGRPSQNSRPVGQG